MLQFDKTPASQQWKGNAVKIAMPFGVSLGLWGIMVMMSAGLWQALPAGTQLPLHLGLGSDGSGLAPAPVVLSILPLLGLVVTLAFALVPRISQRVHRSPGAYTAAWLLSALVLAVCQGLIIRHALFTLAALKGAAGG